MPAANPLAWRCWRPQARRPALVLVPQGRDVWDGGFGRTRNTDNKLDLPRDFVPSDDLKTAQRLLLQVLADFPGIDRKRLYLTGISQGGLGTWAWNLLEPELFAAMVPVCVFTGHAIAALRHAGGQPRHTEYDTTTYFSPMAHFAWVPAYQTEEMREWLFKQTR